MRENPPLEQRRDVAADASGRHAVDALVDALRPFDRHRAEVLHAAAHGMRTPLTSIVGFLELLRDGAAGPVSPEQDRILNTIARNTAELTALVDALEAGVPGRVPPVPSVPSVSPVAPAAEEFRPRG